jgi:hypothetical protein
MLPPVINNNDVNGDVIESQQPIPDVDHSNVSVVEEVVEVNCQNEGDEE